MHMQAQNNGNHLPLEQKRARHAWEKAGKGVEAYGSEYVNTAKALPALIMNSGLMQVMAFCHDKSGRHEAVASHLREWLHITCGTPQDFVLFMEAMMGEKDAVKFQRINAEAMAWLKWLRQMAAAR